MTKYEVKYTSTFKRSFKKIKHNKSLLDDLNLTIKKLANDEILDLKYKDHQLSNNLKEYRECHIRPDFLLMYKKDKNMLILTCADIGSHSDLFK